jgi:hypothetical protein
MDYDNLEEIAEKIFSKPYGEPNSIRLELEEITSDIAFNYGIESFISNILYIITMKGIKILYGKDINVLNLTEKQLDTIKMYVKSYGYKLIISNNPNEICKIRFEKFI